MWVGGRLPIHVESPRHVRAPSRAPSKHLGSYRRVRAVDARDGAGANAEPEESGGSSLFFSPGLSYTIWPQLQLYAFAQLPLYRYVNGTQLAVNWAAVSGLTFRF